jgi:hypothetical protein
MPRLSELGVQHDFFEIVVIQVGGRTEKRVRPFGCACGKKIVIGTPKNWASLSKSEMDIDRWPQSAAGRQSHSGPRGHAAPNSSSGRINVYNGNNGSSRSTAILLAV